jgi:hypothetical protein
MPRSIEKIKLPSSINDFWRIAELKEPISNYPQSTVENSCRAFFELPIYWWSSSFSISTDNKSKKLGLVRFTRKKNDKQNLPMVTGWEISDGDYSCEPSPGWQNQFPYKRIKKRLERIYFFTVLAVVTLVVLLFASIASSISLPSSM